MDADVVRVEYQYVEGGVWAVYKTLRAFGPSEKEAVECLIPVLEEALKARVASATDVTVLDSAEATDKGPDDRRALPGKLLRSLAGKHKPAASWYEEEILP
jgi:hypothetical protein